MESQDSQYSSVTKAFNKADEEINKKARKAEVLKLVRKVDVLASYPDFKLSDPPTIEEIRNINDMKDGTLYTINGGSSVKIFRRRAEAHTFNAVSFASAQSASHRKRYEDKPIDKEPENPFSFYSGLREVPQRIKYTV